MASELDEKHIQIRIWAQESQKFNFEWLRVPFLALFWPHFAAIAPSWHPFGDVGGLFRLAFSAFARLEPQGEPFQHHFVDLVSFSVPLLRIVDALLLKTYKILGGRLAPLRGRGRAAGAARRPLRRHFLFLFCAWIPLWTYQCSATLPAQWCFPFFGSSGF